MGLLIGIFVTLLGCTLGFGGIALGMHFASAGKNLLGMVVINASFLAGCILFVNGMTIVSAS